MATGAYDANGIWNYGEDDNIALFSDTLNLLSESTSDAFTDDRSRLATLEAGSLSGLIPVKPTSVVVATGTASVNTLGVVSFSGATALSLNGVFSSEYKNYKIITNLSAAGGGQAFYGRMRKAGTDNTSTNYTLQGYFANGTTITNYSNMSTNALDLSDAVSSGTSIIVTELTNIFYQPSFISNSQSVLTTSQNFRSSMSGVLKVTDTFDGITFYQTSGAFTGAIQIFAYND